ncbi:hypothetical protein FJ428_04905 [Mesorhizobium sp. B2-8-1]|nr:hypothetical protein FJ428_04905 [Mesorhizobium sp. B2-8-1]TPM03482.1 hypothetical protein FJ939_18150 [Mesorhizobium sp. B2-3-8]TPM12830.1 hypothetical protein FJ940_20295 [Mesorhizobium sp. B2-3-7]
MRREVRSFGIDIAFFFPSPPVGRRWPREARSDEGCSREHQRLIPLEHPSTVSALRADPPSPTRG